MRKFLTLTLCMALLMTSASGLFAFPACAEGTITDAVFKYYNSTTAEIENKTIEADRFITPGFSAPVFKTGEGAITDPSTSGYYSANNLSSWFQMFGDTNSYKNNYMLDVPDQLKTSTYIRLDRNWRNPRTSTSTPNANPDATDVLSFKINKTAVVYYVYPDTKSSSIATNAPWLNTQGWTEDGTVQFVESNYSDNSKTENPTPKNYILMKKLYRVADGETATVNIGGYYLSYFVPMVYVSWVDDPTTLASVSNAQFKLYDKTTSTASYIDVLENGGEIVKGFTEPVYNGSITNDSTAAGYYSTANMDSYFPMFTDSYNYFYTIPEYLKDSTYLRLKKAWREPRTGEGSADNPNAMNAQSEVLVFDIDTTANVYYVFPNKYVSTVPTNAKWLNEEGWTLCDGDKVQFFESANKTNETLTIKDANLIFRKKFIVTPGSSQTVKIGGFYQNWFTPMVFVDWVNENTTKNVSVSVGANGTVDKTGNWDVAKGETFTITATPADGYEIDTIKFNGAEVPVVGNTYTTPEIDADATIEVTFKKSEPKQPSIEHTYTEVFTSSTPQTINGKEISDPMSIVFAKVLDFTGYTLQDFGMEFAADRTVLEAGNGKKCSATAGKSSLGNYGICFYGNFEQGKTYYTRPYAIYVKDGEEPLIVTGETILEIVPNPNPSSTL